MKTKLKEVRKFIFLTLASLVMGIYFLGAPIPAQAINCSQPSEGIDGISILKFNRAIVPCGRSCDDDRTVEFDETKSCTLCHMLILVKNIFDLMFAWLIILALISLTIGGVVYIVSVGNPGTTSFAKGIITKTLMGFAGFILAWLLVYTILVFLSAKNSDMLGIDAGDRWYEFNCRDDSAFDAVPPPPPPGGGGGAVPPPGGGTTGGSFDPDIAPQIADASASLVALIDCVNIQIPDSSSAARRISSISDSAGMAFCSGATYAKPPCAHAQYSCHYGGTTCAGTSVAVDYGAEEYAAVITAAVNACGQSLHGANPYILNEGDHLHVSLGTILGCGCN
jgi:hypothetical protein